jgi:hypothetical protein
MDSLANLCYKISSLLFLLGAIFAISPKIWGVETICNNRDAFVESTCAHIAPLLPIGFRYFCIFLPARSLSSKGLVSALFLFKWPYALHGLVKKGFLVNLTPARPRLEVDTAALPVIKDLVNFKSPA